MNGEVKVFDLRMSESLLSSTSCAPNGLSALAVHQHSRVFATTSAPAKSYGAVHSGAHGDGGYAINGRHGGGHSTGQAYTSGRNQKLSVWRLEDIDEDHLGTASTESGTYDSGYNASPANGGGIAGPAEQPTKLSDMLLRGNTAPLGGTTANLGANIPPVRNHRLVGAGMNAMIFHPNELVLAVGGFDHAFGGIRLIGYDKKERQRHHGVVDGVLY
jgi:hypothetical protein